MDKLPVIDLETLRGGCPDNRARIVSGIGHAAREVGFFRISGHGVNPDLVTNVYRLAEAYFALPDHEKRRLYIGGNPTHRGYVPFDERGDYADEFTRNYEAFDIGHEVPADDPDFLAGNRFIGPNVWPDIPGFQETVSAYFARMSEVGLLICGCLEDYLGLGAGSITGNMSKPLSQLRLMHYLRQSAQVDSQSVNMGAHTDYECLTLLHTRHDGLQVMTRDDQWIDVPADPSVYVVNIGDMLEAWSNGILRSTPHRVINQCAERYSLPYFLAANHDTMIAPFPDLVKQRGGARYAPFLAGAHLEQMLKRDFPYLRQIETDAQEIASGSAPGPFRNPFEQRIEHAVD